MIDQKNVTFGGQGLDCHEVHGLFVFVADDLDRLGEVEVVKLKLLEQLAVQGLGEADGLELGRVEGFPFREIFVCLAHTCIGIFREC